MVRKNGSMGIYDGDFGISSPTVVRNDPFSNRLNSGYFSSSDPNFSVDYSGLTEVVGAVVKTLVDSAAGVGEFVAMEKDVVFSSDPSKPNLREGVLFPYSNSDVAEALTDAESKGLISVFSFKGKEYVGPGSNLESLFR